MAMKRKRIFAARNFFGKKRKFGRRKRTGRRRVVTFTSNKGTATSVGFKARKTPKKLWRKLLWNDTLFKTHYRSVGNGAATLQTGAVLGQGSLTVVDPFFIGTPGPTTAFWTVSGGLETPDTGETAPTFGPGDIVIRGGIIGTTINLQANTLDSVNVKVWTVWKVSNPVAALAVTPVNYGVDPTGEADFTQLFGKVIDVREAVLGAECPSLTITRRLRISKIDKEVFGTNLGLHPVFLIAVTNLSDTSDIALTSITWHNLSFTADPIT